jgi:hypothetical protein
MGGGQRLAAGRLGGDCKRADATVVRVIEYTLDVLGCLRHDAPCQLIATILDHQAAPRGGVGNPSSGRF